QRPTTNDQQPTTNNQRPTTNDQRPTTKNQQSTTNNQQSTTNNQQPTIDNQQLETNLGFARSLTVASLPVPFQVSCQTRNVAAHFREQLLWFGVRGSAKPRTSNPMSTLNRARRTGNINSYDIYDFYDFNDFYDFYDIPAKAVNTCIYGQNRLYFASL